MLNRYSLTLAIMLFTIIIMATLLSSSATAQKEGPPATPASSTGIQGLSHHESWVKDLPYVPVYQTDLSYPNTSSFPIPLQAPESMTPDARDWTDLVFSSFRDGNWEIYGAYAPWYSDGLKYAIRMTNHPGIDYRPRLRPGGTHIAFATTRDGNYEIYLMNWGGSNLRQLTNNPAYDSQPFWSPDGNKLLFVSERDGNLEIYVMQVNGSNPTRLTNNVADDFNPSWSPDGNQIAWVRETSEEFGVVYVMNTDGSNPHAITGPLRYVEHPSWSPNGTQIALDYDANLDGWNDLAIMNADGGNLHAVFLASNLFDYWEGAWQSISRSELLFTRIRYILYQGELYIEYACIGNGNLHEGVASCKDHSNLDFYPDSQLRDITIPVTSVEPLPPYSRAWRFPVSVVGSDPGPAVIYAMEVQYRNGVGGQWTNWETSVWTNQATFTFSGNPGTTVYFRSRGRDWANHWEPWPPGDGDTYTQLYSWELDGKVTDSRSAPIVDTPVIFSPVSANNIFTDLAGKFLAYLSADGSQTMEVGKAGYSSLPASNLNIHSDGSFDTYLPPIDNIVDNGGFENGSPLEGWVTGDVLPATVSDGHTGDHAARLGLLCPQPCLTDPQPTSTGEFYSFPHLAVDSENILHMIWNQTSELFYSYRDNEGIWAPPLHLGLMRSGNIPEAFEHAIAVDRNGTVHVAWAGNDLTDNGLMYREKPAGGSWSDPINLGVGIDPDIAVDLQGGVHITYSCSEGYFGCTQSGAFYLERQISGIWQAPILISYSGDGHQPKVAAGPDNTVHFLFSSNSGAAVVYRSRLPDGTMTNSETAIQGGQGNISLIVDRNGIVYALIGDHYSQRSSNGLWSETEVLPHQVHKSDMTIDNKGVVTILGEYGSKLYFFEKYPGVLGFAMYQLPDGYVYSGSVVVDGRDSIHMVWNSFDGLMYQTTARAADYATTSISRSFRVPASLNKPTLAFMYSLAGDAYWATSNIEVTIENQATATQIFSTTSEVPWQLAWVDLQPWAGQDIIVTFSLHQSAGEPYIQFYLDDVSVGSWLTPVVSNITPSKLEVWASEVITISGDNFLLNPTVRLNDIPVPGVEWVNERTLRLILPGDLPPGFYNVWVINPGGQEGVKPNGLLLGKTMYLPVVSR